MSCCQAWTDAATGTTVVLENGRGLDPARTFECLGTWIYSDGQVIRNAPTQVGPGLIVRLFSFSDEDAVRVEEGGAS